MTYKNGKIYKLWCLDCDDTYVGSTTQPLSTRLYQHKTQLNCSSKILFEKSDNVKIELIEEFPCENKDQLNQREGHWIREINCVNKNIAGRTVKEWYQDNQEQIKQYRLEHKEQKKERDKKYYQDNKEQMLEQNKQYRLEHKEQIREQHAKKYNCDCGGRYRYDNKGQHLKTKIHLNWEKNRNNNININ